MSTRIRMLLGVLVVAVVWPGSGCTSNGEGTSESRLGAPTYQDLVAMAGFSQYAVYDGDFVDLYHGEQVLRSYVETGDFAPGPDVAYSLFHVPRSLVEAAQAAIGEPVTWSLCRPDDQIRIFHQAVGPQWEEPTDEIENCTPWIQHYAGRMTIEYRGGAEGVFGYIQAIVYPPGRLPIDGIDAPNGLLMVGVTVQAAMPSPCEEIPAPTSGYLQLGIREPDEDPDDPLLADCAAPQSEP